jgi:uncharacterized protein
MDRPLLVHMPLGEDRETAVGASRAIRVARTRSVACGAECHARACTLREMTEARQLATDPRLILWIELLTVAHLVGEAEPRPDDAWLGGLRRAAAPRILQCAIAHLVQSAIDARYVHLAADYQPEHLAQHVADRANRRIAGEGHYCDGSEVQWQAGRFRWIDAARSLRNQDGDVTRPHPRTREWADRGLQLRGGTRDEQFQDLLRHPFLWRPSYRSIVGAGTPPPFERAAARLSRAADPIDRLVEAISFMTFDNEWPVLRLRPARWRARRARGQSQRS